MLYRGDKGLREAPRPWVFTHKDMGVAIKWGTQNGWFPMENPIEMDDLGVPLFQETSIIGSIYTAIDADVCEVFVGGTWAKTHWRLVGIAQVKWVIFDEARAQHSLSCYMNDLRLFGNSAFRTH